MPPDRSITVAGCQIPQNIGNREANIRTAMDAIRATPGHDIYVLPELSSSGYDEMVFDQLEDLAENWDGPSFKAFSRLSRDLGCYICYSFPRRNSSGAFTIAAAVVGPSGGIEAKYDKWHVCKFRRKIMSFQISGYPSYLQPYPCVFWSIVALESLQPTSCGPSILPFRLTT